MKNNFELMDTFMIRVPSLPIDLHFKMISDNVQEDTHILNKLPTKHYHRLKEAIQTSSLNFYNSIIDFEKGNKIKIKENFMNSEYKYFIRANSRCTPFGLLAGVAFGKYSTSETEFELDDLEPRRYLRPDMCWLMQVIKSIELKYRNKLSYKLNEAVVKKHGRAFLLNSTKIQEKVLSANIRYTKPFEVVKNIASDSYIPFNDILNELKKYSGDLNTDILNNFLNNLVSNEYLISSLRPPLTKQGQFEHFLKELKKVDIEVEALNDLQDIAGNINLYNKDNNENKEDLYKKLLQSMERVLKTDNYLQVDAKAKLKKNNINEKFNNDVNGLLNVLMKFNSTNVEYPYWQDYKNKFLDVYGENRLIPLVEVLDETCGIGLPNGYTSISSKDFAAPPFFNELSNYFQSKYCYALKNGLSKLEITDKEINSSLFKDYKYEDIPESLELNFFVTEKDNNFCFELGELTGLTAAGKSFGRFSHMMDNHENFFKQKNDSHKNICNNKNDYVTCEVSAMPVNERSANVISNNHASDYEISLSTANSREKGQQIRLTDILIGFENDMLYLKSKSLDKRILITINNMFNPNLYPDVIRFLNDISTQGKILWYDLPWKPIFSKHVYIPEIRYKNFILQSERWNISSAILSLDRKCSFEEFSRRFCKYKNDYKVCKYVYMQEQADNKLLINLDNERCLKVLYNSVCTKGLNVWLCKFDKDSVAPVKCGEENYCAELFVPMLKIKKPEKTQQKRKIEVIKEEIPFDSPIRIKKPFDDWLYFKLYGSGKNLSRLIGIQAKEFLSTLKNEGKIKDCFFVRYTDTKEHVRLRINASKADLIAAYPLIDGWLNSLIENFYISRFTIDFYDREIERYAGIECIDYAEKVFAQDSYACAKIFELKVNKKISVDDEILGFINIMSYLDGFRLNLKEKLEFFERNILPSSHRDEFKANRNKFIETAINYVNHTAENEDYSEIFAIFEERKSSIEKYLNQIVKTHNNVNIKYQVLDSIIHMSMNRLFGTDVKFEFKIRSYVRHVVYALNCMAQKYTLKR